jgi:DNA-binding SARP family transcriptional activator
MELYQESGRAADAIKQYATCRTALARELGIEPGEKTRTLYARLKRENGDSSGVTVELERVRVPTLDAAIAELAGAVERLREAQAALAAEQPNTVRRLLGRGLSDAGVREILAEARELAAEEEPLSRVVFE